MDREAGGPENEEESKHLQTGKCWEHRTPLGEWWHICVFLILISQEKKGFRLLFGQFLGTDSRCLETLDVILMVKM